MKSFSKLSLLLLLAISTLNAHSQTGAIRINQLGYYPDANKIAVVAFPKGGMYEVVNTQDNSVVLGGDLSPLAFWRDAGDSVSRCDFSTITMEGTYKIRIPGFGESYPFTISKTVLRKAAYASLKSYYYQRSSYQLTAPYAGLWARPEGHPDTACIMHSSTGKTGKMSSPGGWYDAGDYGKYVVNAGISVASMLSFYENCPNFFEDGSIHIPESGNGQNDLLDEMKFELDWLKTMQDVDGGVFFKVTTLNFSGFVMPDKDVAARYVIGKSSSSTLDFAALMAMAGRIYAGYDADYAADCIIRAENAWIWAKANPAIYFKNPSDVSTGEYGDGNVSDEFIWAAAELYITTAKAEYKTYLEGKSSSLKYQSAPGWGSVQPLASLSLATQANGLSETILTSIKNSITSTADTWVSQIAAHPDRIPQYSFYWGSNSQVANEGVGILYAYLLTKDVKYIKAAAECADYLLGKNATGFSFVSGYGSKTPMHFHHRPSEADGVVQPVPGFVSGGPNPGREDEQQYPFTEAAKSFVDVTGSYASNEVCINWNSPMTVLFAGVDAFMGDGSAVDFEVPTQVNNPPTVSISSPSYGVKIGSDSPITVKGSASDADGISKVELYIDSRYYDEATTGSFQWNLNSLALGNHTATILAFDTNGLTTEKTNTFTKYLVADIPGKVEAENYYTMSGVTTQVTTDTDGGLNLNGITTADYVDYSVIAAEAGYYRVDYRIASPTAGGILELRKASGYVLSSMTVPSTGGTQKWQTISDTISLSGIKQTIRIYAVAGGWNINWMNFVLLDGVSVQNPLADDKNISVRIVPNPVISDFAIQYKLTEISPVDFLLFDHNGKLVTNQKDVIISSLSGEYSWKIDRELAPGNYFVSLQQDGQRIATTKLVVAK